MKYAAIDAAGGLLAFYDTDAFPQVPEGAVPLTDEQHRFWQEFQGARWDVDAGDLVLVETPPAPEPVPVAISDRQFFQQLALDGYITQAEALAAVRTGELPAVLADLLGNMDADERFGAEMLLSGAVEFRRDHPLTAAIGEARGLTPEEVDDFFRRAAAL